MFNSQGKAAGANSTNTSNWRYWRWMVIHVTGVHYKQKTTVVYNKLIYIIELLFVFINIGKSARCSEFNVNISMG